MYIGLDRPYVSSHLCLEETSEKAGFSNTLSVRAAAIFRLNGVKAANSAKIYSVSLGLPIGAKLHLKTDAYVVKQFTGRLSNCSLKVDFDLSKISASDFKCSLMDLLLGTDVYLQIMLEDVKRDPRGSLTALSIVFGWILTLPNRIP